MTKLVSLIRRYIEFCRTCIVCGELNCEKEECEWERAELQAW